ncbi:hypothetical protein Franean1_0068 [Parafrankia sp. EAN1pec]|nr:hypothetical protein Franean1_0068 [Frankia sp. EAN1pec]
MIVRRERVARALPAYLVGRQLGAGAYGLVLAGRHRRLRRPVAIKVLEAGNCGHLPDPGRHSHGAAPPSTSGAGMGERVAHGVAGAPGPARGSVCLE